jgi:hypothetical protein
MSHEPNNSALNSDPPPNCVRVWNIPKTLNLSVRHFDTILEAMRGRIGKIKHLMVWRNTSGEAANNNTCAFIELHDARRHFELIHAIQGATFHGNRLTAQMAHHRFNNLDDDYAPRTTSCLECEKFEERLCEWEEDFMQEALVREKRRRATEAGVRKVPPNYFRHAKQSISTAMGQSMLNMQINDEHDTAEVLQQQQTASMIVANEYDDYDGDDGSSMSSFAVLDDPGQ